tara:strand:+ start:72518 stop:73228 length:711 start_codon:yes stop_codon:yes gene_type:complete
MLKSQKFPKSFFRDEDRIELARRGIFLPCENHESDGPTRFHVRKPSGRKTVVHRFPKDSESCHTINRAWAFSQTWHRPITHLSERWSTKTSHWVIEDVDELSTISQILKSGPLETPKAIQIGWAIHRALKRSERLELTIDSLHPDDVYLGDFQPKIRLRALPSPPAVKPIGFAGLLSLLLNHHHFTTSAHHRNSSSESRSLMLQNFESALQSKLRSPRIIQMPFEPSIRADFLGPS